MDAISEFKDQAKFAVLTFERRRAERRGFRGAPGGAVTAIQRFESALNLNVHFHNKVRPDEAGANGLELWRGWTRGPSMTP